MGSSLSNKKHIVDMIDEFGLTKDNLTNELQQIYNKYKMLVDDNKKLLECANKYQTKILELEKINSNYLKLLDSNKNHLQNMEIEVNRITEEKIELTNKYKLMDKNVSIFKNHNDYLLKVNSKLLENKVKSQKTIKLTDKYIDLIDKEIKLKDEYIDVINNIDFHIKNIIGNQEFNIWIPDDYEKKLCKNTIIYLLSILSKT